MFLTESETNQSTRASLVVISYLAGQKLCLLE